MQSDGYNRNINYLRISLTERCNLRCCYCEPFASKDTGCRSQALSLDELFRVAKAAVELGVTKLRLTGGEPLLRKGLVDFCARLAALPGVDDLAISTNGLLLEDMARPLAEAGVRRVNLSLDSLERELYARLTGSDKLPQVLAGLAAAEKAGLTPIKINTVVMRGLNDHEVADLAALTLDHPYQVRFIELMPTSGWAKAEHARYFISAEEIMQKVASLGGIQKLPWAGNSGPARYYRLEGAQGLVGVIAALTQHFCSTCNRIRLTADGNLRPCLFSDHEISLRPALDADDGGNALKAALKTAIQSKPWGHHLGQEREDSPRRPMRAIGG